MKDNYDFSLGERGKFYNAQAELSFPIHLEPDVDAQMTNLAEKSGVDVQTLVNAWLRANLKVIESLQVE
ncbi:MAG: hypothetical protein AAFV90_22020 [Cyanobacteria bacterium J06634_5]